MGVRVIGGWRASPGFVIPVMAISAVFYFVGAVVALVQLVRFVRGRLGEATAAEPAPVRRVTRGVTRLMTRRGPRRRSAATMGG